MNESNDTKNANNDAVTLRIRDKAKKQFYERILYDHILHGIKERIPSLVPGSNYTVKEICGVEFWDSLVGVERNIAGKFAVNMVEQGYLPLEKAGRRSDNSALYRLK